MSTKEVVEPTYLAGLPECELSPGVLCSRDAEVNEGTGHADVKVEREELALHEAKSMSWKASEKQEACAVQGITRQNTSVPSLIPAPTRAAHDIQTKGPYLRRRSPTFAYPRPLTRRGDGPP